VSESVIAARLLDDGCGRTTWGDHAAGAAQQARHSAILLCCVHRMGMSGSHIANWIPRQPELRAALLDEHCSASPLMPRTVERCYEGQAPI
jgi:hypothetical protein